MSRNFGIPPRDPDNGDPPFHWVDDRFVIAPPDSEGVLVVTAVWAICVAVLFFGVMWVVVELIF